MKNEWFVAQRIANAQKDAAKSCRSKAMSVSSAARQANIVLPRDLVAAGDRSRRRSRRATVQMIAVDITIRPNSTALSRQLRRSGATTCCWRRRRTAKCGTGISLKRGKHREILDSEKSLNRKPTRVLMQTHKQATVKYASAEAASRPQLVVKRRRSMPISLRRSKMAASVQPSNCCVRRNWHHRQTRHR